MRARMISVALLALACSALAACGSDGSDGADGGASPSSVTQVADGTTTSSGDAPARVRAVTAAAVDEPISLEVRPGDDHLWLAERAGRVWRLAVADDGRSLRKDGDAVLDITSDTTTEAERGLLSIAFSTDGASIYVSHTDAEGNTRVESYGIEDDTVDVGSKQELLAVDQPYPNHNGGNVVLGPDGKLWFGLGDGGSADDPERRAQDPDTLLGKIVRFDPSGGDPEIVVTGVRNPWRFSFDPDGGLWVGDVGQNEIEEIDHLAADDIEGANLGWSAFEGSERFNDDVAEPADAVAPVFEYRHEGGNCSITGGFTYQGTALEGLQGAYLYADYCAGRIRAVRLDDEGAFEAELDLGIDVAGPVSFGADADGEPYVLSGGGDIVRLVPA